MQDTFLQIKKMNISFYVKKEQVNILKDINLKVNYGDSIAIIGESGSGKSILTKAICGILPSNLSEINGEILFKDEPIELKEGINKKSIGIVLQNPMQTFNPTIKIGTFMKDVFEANNIEDDANNSKKIEIIEKVGIKNAKSVLEKYPHELSGGMLQRIAIAITLSKKPEVLICDEPTSSLDIVMQNRIIELIKEERKKQNFILLFITHDMSTIDGLCENIVVMEKGRIIEEGNTKNVFANPQHPYTKKLIQASIF